MRRIVLRGVAVVTGAMVKSMPEPDAIADDDFALAHPLRPYWLAAVMTLLAYSGGVLAVGALTRAFVAPFLWLAWVIVATAFLVLWLAIVVAMRIRQPDARETVLIWGQAGRFIIIGSQTVVAWAIWSFFPTCPEALRLMLAGMFLGCSPAQMIASPENVLANRIGILASYGSVALYFLRDGSENALAMSGFAAVVGVMLFVLCDYVASTVADTAAARIVAVQAMRELERALAAVAAERDAKTQFIAAASHDLGQPLQAASLFFDQTLRAPNAVQRSQAADGVRKAFESADQLLSHMLNHLRLEADAVDPQFARLSVGPVMARIAAQFSPAAKAAGITIKVVHTGLQLWMDRVLLERALGNLVNNAIQHSGATRIVMGVRGAGSDFVRIWVLDDGRGVAPGDANHLFEDYYRGSAPAVTTGFGLGLSSVRRIATLLHGDAGLDLRWQNGAAFYLQFPTLALAQERRS